MAKKRDYIHRYHFNRYKTKRFQNPYFKKKEVRTRPQVILFVIGLLFVLTGTFYLFGFANFWDIQRIQVEGLSFMGPSEIKELANEQLNARRYLIFPQRSSRFLNLNELEKKLSDRFSFERLDVGIQNKVLVIRVKERISEVVLTARDKVFYVDVSGTVIRELAEADRQFVANKGTEHPTLNGNVLSGPYPAFTFINSIPLIVLEKENHITPGEIILQGSGVAGIITFDGFAKENDLRVISYSVERKDSAWARAELQRGFDVLIDITQDIENQMASLMRVIEYEIEDERAVKYIDIRFGNHVFIKD